MYGFAHGVDKLLLSFIGHWNCH